YDPETDTWTPITTVDAPSCRTDHSAVWTGTRMIVWGGIGCGDEDLDSGGRYDPVTDKWSSMTMTEAPEARSDNAAVWTGSLMLVAGGHSGRSLLDTGGRYDPVGDK